MIFKTPFILAVQVFIKKTHMIFYNPLCSEKLLKSPKLVEIRSDIKLKPFKRPIKNDFQLFFDFKAAVKTMEKDPLRWHGGIKVSMAVAFNEGMHGLAQEMPKVRY